MAFGKKVITYTWDEDLQRVMKGELPYSPDASDSPDDRRPAKFVKRNNYTMPLPGSREWHELKQAERKIEAIAEAETAASNERDKQQKAYRNTSDRARDNSDDGEVKTNANTAQVSDNDRWAPVKFMLFVVALMLIVAYLASH